MDELARLGLRIESDQVETADSRLDSFTESAVRSERATDALAAGSAKANSAIGAMMASIDRSVRELVELTRAHQAVALATDRAATANIRFSSSFTPLARAAETAAAATSKLGTSTEVAGMQAVKAGVSFDTFYEAAQRDFSTQFVAQMGKATAAHTAGGKAARLQAGELLNLTRQLSDVGVTAAMGMNPLMIAIQQGPQIADIFQTAAARGVKTGSVFKEIGGIVGGVLGKAGPFAVGAVVLGTLGAAFLAADKDATAFANTARATGNAAGLTFTQVEAAAARIGDATEVGTGKARAALMALADTGKFSGSTLLAAGDLVTRISVLSGKAAGQVAGDFAGMGDDVAAFAIKFNAQYHVLTAAQIEHIRLMQEQGDVAGATSAFILDAQQKLADRGPAQLGYLERAWHGVAMAIDDAWTKLKGFGAQDSGGSKRLAQVESQIREAQTQLAGSGGQNAYVAGRLRDLISERTFLQGAQKAQADYAKSQADANAVQQQGAEAQARMNSQWSAGADSLTKYRNDLKAYSADLDRMRKAGLSLPSEAEQAAQRAKIYERDMPKAAQAAKSAESASASAAKAAQHRAEALSRESDATLATTVANFDLAHAYGVSVAAAFEAQARAEAVGKAITKQGDIDAFVQRQRDLNASKAAVDGAKAAATLDAQTVAQRFANQAVMAGTKTQAEAAQAMQDGLVVANLIAIAEQAGLENKKKLLAIVETLAKAQRDHNDAVRQGAMAAVLANQRDELENLRLEGKLIGANNSERIKALAIQKAQQQLRASGFNFATATPDQFKDAKGVFEGAGALADVAARNKTAQDAYNLSLEYQLDLLRSIDDQARTSAQGMADSFGKIGASLGQLMTVMTGYDVKQREIADARARYVREGGQDAARLALFERDKAAAELQNYGDLAGAAKSFFGEKTALYKAAQAAEQAFRLYEFAMSVRAMIQHSAETASVATNEAAKTAISIPAATARAAAKTAEGAASMFAALGPLGFAAVAAMVAVMASFGISGGSSKAVPGANDAADRQKAQGAGSVLGDATAKSESLAKAMEIVASNTNRDLEYSNQMLRSLRSIDSQIGTVAAALARSLGASGAFSTDGLNLGTTTRQGGLVSRGVGALGGGALGGLAGGALSTAALGAFGLSGAIGVGLSSGLATLGTQIGSLLGPIGAIAGAVLGPLLFSAKTTRTVQDQGLQFNAQTLGALMSGGVQGQTYQQILETTKKSFIGINYSTKNSTSTVNGGLDEDFARQVTQLIGSLRGTVLEGAKVLGVDGAQAVLDAFEVNLGKISFKDLKGDEIEKALEAVFGKLGDDLAAAAIPGLVDLQKVGEGAFETLARVARDYQVLDISLKSIGMTFGSVGLSSLAARENLIDLVGSLDDLVDQTNFFAENFLTDVERMAPIQKAVADELARLNLQSVVTKEQFKAVVLGLDLTTQAGRDTYAALLSVAPAFLKVADFATDGSQQVKDAKDALSKAYDREASDIQATIDKFKGFSTALAAFRDQLYSGPAAMLSPEEQYRASKALFDSTAARARGGDADALGDLQNVSQAYLDASKAYYASSKGYFDDLEAVRAAVTASQLSAASQVTSAEAQLEQLKMQVKGLIKLDEDVLSVRDAILALNMAQAGQTPATAATFDAGTYANDNADLVEAFKAYAAGSNPYGFTAGLDMAGFMKEHYDRTGQYEIAAGQRKFALGGAFSGPVGGASDLLTRPTQLNVGQGGEAGPEAIMPLARGPDGSLGVRSNGGDSDALRAEIIALKGEVSNLSRQLSNIARASMEQQAAIHREAQGARKAGNEIAEGARKAAKFAKAS